MVPDNKDNLSVQFAEENRKVRKINQTQNQEDYEGYKKDLEFMKVV